MLNVLYNFTLAANYKMQSLNSQKLFVILNNLLETILWLLTMKYMVVRQPCVIVTLQTSLVVANACERRDGSKTLCPNNAGSYF